VRGGGGLERGIGSALGAGLGVVAIPNRAYPPDPGVLEQAHVVLDSLAELGEDAIERASSVAVRLSGPGRG
jgi:hypothetical protein